ncbi:MAG: energy-coupling factor ABC transporter substrate-binding protein [Candidatus Bathyarchaeota archaeon]|nr:energy-coupling factor ABC transporter substrate-binding protein [Candidatus Termiticorpusculum sp.]
MNSKRYLILIAFIACIFAVYLILLPNMLFGDAGERVTQALYDTGVEARFSPVWEPPGREIAILLFALQATVGVIIVGYFIGYEKRKRE